MERKRDKRQIGVKKGKEIGKEKEESGRGRLKWPQKTSLPAYLESCPNRHEDQSFVLLSGPHCLWGGQRCLIHCR